MTTPPTTNPTTTSPTTPPTTGQTTIKRLRFVRRPDSVAADAFGAWWRERASELHDAAPPEARAARLVHCVVRPGRTDRPFHGVAIEWFHDEANLAAYDGRADPALVSARVDSRTVRGQEPLEAWWRAPAGAPRLLLLGLIQRAPGLSRAEFADYWWHTHRPLADELMPADAQPTIYVHDYARAGEACDWDGVGEFYDTSVDVARARTRWGEGTPAIVADEERFLVRDTRWALITDAEVVVAGD